jgi:hypothetical protein
VYFPATGFWQILDVAEQVWSSLASGWTQPTPQDEVTTIMVVVNGKRVSAFHEGTFMGFADSNHIGPGRMNDLSLRSNGDVSARVHISNIRFWNLDAVEWTTDEWITAQPESVLIDSFIGKEDLRFYPQENGTLSGGKAVLFTKAGETSLTRNDLHWKNIALEASFIPKTMPDSASLVWVFGKDDTTLDCLEFSYFPNTGEWQINKVVNRQWEMLISGMTQPTPVETGVMINVVAQGNQVSVYLDQGLIGSVEVDRSDASSRNELVLRSKENIYTRVDIERIRSWNLPLIEPVSEEESVSLEDLIYTMTGGIPDFTDSFEGAMLHEYWANDPGAQEASLQDGALRLNNEFLIGYRSIASINYILQVDLRFGGLEGMESFVYGIRTTELSDLQSATEYLLIIQPSSGDWSLKVISNPNEPYIDIQNGNLGAIESDRWYQLGAVVDMETVSVYWEDKLLFTEAGYRLYGTDNHFGLEKNSAGNATLDIDNWRYWDLGTPAYMRNDWISDRVPTFSDDNFTPDEGWVFNQENEKYDYGKAVLYTNGEQSFLTREDFFINNFVLEANFSPRDMPDLAWVGFLLRTTEPDNMLMFRYYSTTGYWDIAEEENQQVENLVSGWTQPTPQDSIARISVVMDGDRLSAFLGETFLGYAESSLSAQGARNMFVISGDGVASAQVDILKIALWNLDTPEMMIPERVYLQNPIVEEDDFVPDEGWVFGPAENEKYDAGRAVLFTDGSSSSIERGELAGTEFAMQATFIPRVLPASASLQWNLRGDYSPKYYIFEFSPGNGSWLFAKLQNEGWNYIASGSAQPVAQDTISTIMLIVNADQVSVFQDQILIERINIDLSGAETMHPQLVLLSNNSGYAQVDITKIVFWNLE